MKNIIKKITVAVCAISVSALLSVACINAAETPRPMPNGGETATTQNVSTSNGSQADTNVTAPQTNSSSVTNNMSNTVTQPINSTVTNKKYLSKVGGFLWFLLSVIVNFVVSCWVANKFYQLTKKNAQGSSEIRALRKDIEEKFASTLKDISEPAVEIINSNENFARNDEGMVMPERRNHVEMNDEEREIVRRWDTKRSMTRDDEETQTQFEDEEEAYRPKRERYAEDDSFRPSRRQGGIDFEDDDEDEEIYEENDYQKNRPSRMTERNIRSERGGKKGFSVSKAKDFLSNIFPFDE